MNSKELLERYYDYIATPLVDEISEITKPYFDRLEQLEKENKELKEDNLQMQGWYDCYFIENEKLEKENKELKEDLEESFDYNALRQLKINSLEEENTKLKKAFEILKNGFEVILSKSNFPIPEIKYSIAFKFNKDGVWIHISQEEFELFKEVLGDDR